MPNLSIAEIDTLLAIIVVVLFIASFFFHFGATGIISEADRDKTCSLTGTEIVATLIERQQIDVSTTCNGRFSYYNPYAKTINLSLTAATFATFSSLVAACRLVATAKISQSKPLARLLPPTPLLGSYLTWSVLVVGFVVVNYASAMVALVLAGLIVALVLLFILLLLPQAFRVSQLARELSRELALDAETTNKFSRLLRVGVGSYFLALIVASLQLARIIILLY